MDKYTIYKTEKELDKELVFTRIVIFEKCRKYDFKSIGGLKYWYDKNGKTIRIDNDDSSLDIAEFIDIVDIVGFKGNTFLEAGYVYAPYVPVFTTPEVSCTPSEQIASRYSKKRINNNFYGTISVQNL